MGLPRLGVNVDHIATVRQARQGISPDPIEAALQAQRAGAHGIVAHLREDRRHIHDQDIKNIKAIVKIKFNLEMSLNPEIIKIATKVKPDLATLVPERRAEITTEGGLNVSHHYKRVQRTIRLLRDHGVEVSLFIDPVKKQIEEAHRVGARIVELHTGAYAHAKGKQQVIHEFNRLNDMTYLARSLGLMVSAGHGLNYQNTRAIAEIQGI
jgi:pyridoxine 5-phosphate synthase